MVLADAAAADVAELLDVKLFDVTWADEKTGETLAVKVQMSAVVVWNFVAEAAVVLLAVVDQAVTVLLAEVPGDESQVFAAVISGIAFGTSVFLNYGDN